MKPRLVFLTAGLVGGGAEAQVASCAMALQQRGWEPAVISLLPYGDSDRELSAAGVLVYSLGMHAGVPDPRGLARLIAFLARFRPQILHGHMFHGNVLARVARLFCPVPVVLSTLHSVAESGRRSKDVRVRDWVYRITDPLADAVIAVSPEVASRHAQAGAVGRRKIETISNGVDATVFRPDAARRQQTRLELGLPHGFVWLTAGRLMWKKDYPTLLRAFATGRDATLLIAGEGPDEGLLRELAHELAVDVRFLGSRRDMAALMNAADGFVLSSVVEGLPVALIEAAASALPAVATKAGGAEQVVADGVTGLVAPPGDPAALAAAMSSLAALPAEVRAEMGVAARARALALFDVSRTVDAWERLYRGLLESA